jgi:curved DNA-binding protein CbpA
MGIEVVRTPNFESDNYYAILGCPSSSDPDELTKAYRDLSRKYHPDRNPDDDEASMIFLKVGKAYATLCDPNAIIVDEDACEILGPMTPEEAKYAYEKKFGKYREVYYSDGGIIGLPYATELREVAEKSKRIREIMSFRLCGTLRISLFRSWLIKKDIDFVLLLLETTLTWGVVATCKCRPYACLESFQSISYT